MAGRENDEAKAICWLSSYPKSGNTWVRMFLAHYANQGHRVNINSIAEEFRCNDLRASDYHATSPWPLNELGTTDCLFLRNTVLMKNIVRTTKRPVLMKTHMANAIVDEVQLIPKPYTKNAIYMVRDPRDVVLSFASFTGNTVDYMIDLMENEGAFIQENGLHASLIHYLCTWSYHVKSWVRAARFPVLTLKYERMQEEPEEVFRQVLEWIGWEVNEEYLKRSIKNTSFKKMKSQEKDQGFREMPPDAHGEFFRSGKVGGWRAKLTPEQASRIEEAHGEMMETLGYL